MRGETLYFLKRHAEAIAALQKMHVGYFWLPMFLAAAFAQSAQLAPSRQALADFLKARPKATLGWISRRLPYPDEQRDYLLDGLRKAGLPEQ